MKKKHCDKTTPPEKVPLRARDVPFSGKCCTVVGNERDDAGHNSNVKHETCNCDIQYGNKTTESIAYGFYNVVLSRVRRGKTRMKSQYVYSDEIKTLNRKIIFFLR